MASSEKLGADRADLIEIAGAVGPTCESLDVAAQGA
jgi:hypothetical protein